MTGEHRQWAHATDGSGVVQAGRDVVTIHQSGPASWLERPGMVSVEPPWDRIDHRVRGRSDLMADLVQWAANTADRFVVLCGAGGYGKTTLALHFAREQRGQGTTVWWVSAHDEHSVAAGMREVCFRMGVPPDRIQAAQAGQRSASDLLWSNLRAFPHRWLLVVDNADETELVIAPRAARPLGPSWLRSTEGCLGSVLVTSRDGGRNSWGPQAVLLHVPALRADDGARILLDLTHRDDEQFAAARAVAARLGGLPLALRLAGLHSASMATAPELPGLPAIRTFSDYLTALDERFMTTIEATSPRHRARREPRELITETWELSLDVLRKGGQVQARALLRLLSCFANAPIPYELLDARIMAGSPLFAGITPDKLLVLLDGLAELGLTERVTTVERQLPHGPGLVLHPVVRESNRHHHDVKDDPVRYAVLCAALLDSATHDLDHEDSGTWPRWQALVPHCASPLQLWPEAWLGGAEHTDLVRTATATLHRCGRFLYQCGLYEQAEQQLAAALAPQHELLGGEDPDTLKTRGDLASVLTTQGKFDAAEAEFHVVLAAQVKTLGSAHPDTLDTRSRLAVALRARDRLAEAEAEFRAVLTEQVGALGPEHRHTLDTRNRLAHLLHLQSRVTEAEAEFRAVLAARQKLLGEYHLNTLDSRSELASLLHVRGDLPAAEAEYDRLLCAERVALGEDHPKTLVAYSHLVMLRHDQGKLDGLEALYDSILEKQSRVLGPTHLHTLATRHRLAKFHFEQGRLATAQGEFEDVLRQKSRVLGAQHHATLITREYLALTLAARGHTAVAEAELETLLEIRLRTMGDNHPLTAATRANLCLVRDCKTSGSGALSVVTVSGRSRP
ncbi:tetratricopeptide repeat protein [Saccharothrix longispora]|uniref:tetratricopeptide repeat protein n=1 Tax=Saccharothrix longispora TaxID=33920 RepID=UPI0028FD5DF5|nr:tetratricopeptide repeat protein [Saccharothrix longispora]MDU0289714.1 tetratricopeptide repeat protein [Saccharothrix longispora]